MKVSPRLVLGRSATIAAIVAVSPVAVARVSNMGRRAGEGTREEEMKLHLGEKVELGLPAAWPGLVASGGALPWSSVGERRGRVTRVRSTGEVSRMCGMRCSSRGRCFLV